MINRRSSGKSTDVTRPCDCSFFIVQIRWVVAINYLENFAVCGIRIRKLLLVPWISKSLAVNLSADTVRLEVSVAVDGLTLDRGDHLANILTGNESNNIKCVDLLVDFACVFWHIGFCFEVYWGLYLRTVSIICLLNVLGAGWVGLQGSSYQLGLRFSLLGSLGIENLWVSILSVSFRW